MNATKLKYWAAFFMLIDHIGAIMLPPSSMLALNCRLVGRIAFPIFAWFVAESLRKTGDARKYLLRLGLFAFISEGPYLLAVWDGTFHTSVMATFFLAASAMILFERFQYTSPLPIALLPLLGAILLSQVLNTDYGASGVLLVALLYLADGNQKRRLALVGGWCVLEYLVLMPVSGLVSQLPAGGWTPFFGSVVANHFRNVLPLCALMALFAAFSLLLLAQYNGARGKGQKWFFYWFYPLHLLLLSSLHLLIS